MAELIPRTRGSGLPTMTNRDIAELTGKEHDNVRRDIKNLAEALSLSFEEKVEPSNGGRPSKVFVLAKRETLILVSGYSITMRARIIDRWQELEATNLAEQPRVPQTQPEALYLAADLIVMTSEKIDAGEDAQGQPGSLPRATSDQLQTLREAVQQPNRSVRQAA